MTRKITYLISHYPAVSLTFILNEVLCLRKRGLDIDVISINTGDRTDEQLTPTERVEKARTFIVKSAGIGRIQAAQLRLFIHSPLAYLRTFGYALSLSGGSPRALLYHLFYCVEAVLVADAMRRNGSSHLHVHFGSEVATVALLVKKLAPVTLSLTIHGSDEFYDAPGYHLPEKIAAADFIFCVSNYTASQLMRLSDHVHWHKITVAPLGIDVQLFSPGSKCSGKEINILAVGRLNPAKGLHLLIQVFSRLAKNHPELQLTLVGDGEQRRALNELAHTLGIAFRVEFTGALNQDQIMPYYRSADIFCLPSFAEGVPVVLMEAMAMEIPCIASKIAGIPELIDDGVNGLLVTAADTDGLVAALAELVASPERRQQLGHAARRKVAEQYNRETNFERLACLFKARLDALQQSQAVSTTKKSGSLQSHV